MSNHLPLRRGGQSAITNLQSAIKVSVCLPSYNYAAFLPACLASVRAQTFPDFEWIVVDDASTDESVALLRACDDPRLRLVCHAVRRGAVPTWNECLALARGEYVAFLCADDLFTPDKLAQQVAALERAPAAGLVHADGRWANEDGVPQTRFAAVFPPDLQDYLSGDHVTPAPLELRRLAAGYNYIHLSSALFRRRAALALGGFDPRYPYAADWDLWLRLAATETVGYVAQPLALYRRHRRNLTLAMQQSGQEFRDWYGVAEATFRRWPPAAGEPQSVRRAAQQVIREHLLARVHANYARGAYRAVRRDLWLGFRRDPALRRDRLAVLTYLKALFLECASHACA